MELLDLEKLTKEEAEKYFSNNTVMYIITKSGTKYYITKCKKGYLCHTDLLNQPRPLTKAMKKIFC